MIGPARRFRRILPCLAVANLLAMQAWVVLFREGQESPITRMDYAGAVGAVLVAGLGFWLATLATDLLTGRISVRIKAGAALLLWLLVLWAGVKPSVQLWIPYLLGRTSWFTGVALAGGAGVSALLWRAWRDPEGWLKGMARLAWVFTPFIALTFGRAFWRMHLAPEGIQVPQVQSFPKLDTGAHPHRTVVVLFDEFDQQLAFDPAYRLKPLPAFDRLRETAFFAANAYPPMHSTIMSVPAMLTGRLVRAATFRDEAVGDLSLQFADGRVEPYSVQTTLFTTLRAKGYTTLRMNDALFPPVRLKGDADADWVVPPAPSQVTSLYEHLASHLVNMACLVPFAKSMALDIRLLPFLGLHLPHEHVEQVAGQVVALAQEGRADFLFLHILLPHLPVVFDPSRDAFGPVLHPDYRANLLGADRVLARVRRGLEASGRWNDTTLVVISDHFFRNKLAKFGVGDHRVPLLVKFAGESQGAGTFGRPFNTVLFKDMMEGIVEGRLRSPADLGRWIGSHGTFGESPLTEFRKGW